MKPGSMSVIFPNQGHITYIQMHFLTGKIYSPWYYFTHTVQQVQSSDTGVDTHTHMHRACWTHTLTPRLRLRRQCILGLEVMKSLRRWERGSLCCLGDWGSLGTAEGEGGDEAGGAGGGWWGDVNRDISYQ